MVVSTDKTIVEYLSECYPEVLAEYNRYLRRKDLPSIGDIVCTLRPGFGGGAGVFRRVKEISGDYITYPMMVIGEHISRVYQHGIRILK